MKRILILAAAAVFVTGCSSPFQKKNEENDRQNSAQSTSTETAYPGGTWECEAFSVRYPDGWSISHDSESQPNTISVVNMNSEDSQAVHHGTLLITADIKLTGSPMELAERFAEKEDSEQYGLHYAQQATGECQILGYDACYGEYLLSSALSQKLSEEDDTPSKYRACYFQAGDNLFQILLIANSEETFDTLLQEANEALQLTVSE